MISMKMRHAAPAPAARSRGLVAFRHSVGLPKPPTGLPARRADRVVTRVAEAEAKAAAAAAPKPAPAAAKKKAAGGGKDGGHAAIVAEELAKVGDERKLCVISIAPAVRVAIAEAYGLVPGAVKTGQLVTGLRKLGFDKVFDTLLGADLTIMEEGMELLHRLTDHLEGHPHDNEPMPMFTSCCPGWIAMVEKSYPEMIPYLSTCKSPQMMMGAVIKNFFAHDAGVEPNRVLSCSLMPCVRKQSEADRPDGNTAAADGRDVDHVVTTVEMAAMLADAGIDLTTLEESEFDDPLGTGSGGAQLFGTTGGVMEAALRTVVELVEGNPMGKVVFEEVRGLEGIKEATLTVTPCKESPLHKYVAEGPAGGGLQLRIAVANGLGNAKKLVTALKAGEAKYDFIEVMACPGGCIGGGGQPRSADKQILQKRQAAMYSIDERKQLRRSHNNPIIQALYKKWLEEPNSHLAHELLHTSYFAGGPPE